MTPQNADWTSHLLDGRYHVSGKLGEGGMGYVYKAHDCRLGCDIVVKAPRSEMLADPEFAHRFDREIRALVRLSHPHVVKVSDAGLHGGIPFAVLQFLSGGSLDDRRPRDANGAPLAVDPSVLGSWLPAVAAALDYIHRQGYVHRDVKPANVLFDGEGHAYIGDFGVVKAIAERAAQTKALTGVGGVLGTAEYMAPELASTAEVDGRIDQYALAVTVFELLAGRVPFDGPSPAAILARHVSEKAPLLHAVTATVSRELSAVVARAMSKDPNLRFPDCAAFASAAMATLGHQMAPTAPVLSAISATAEAVMDGPIAPAPEPAVAAPSVWLPNPKAIKRVYDGWGGDYDEFWRVGCPNCGRLIKLRAMLRGSLVKCPKCKDSFRAPEVDPDAAATAPKAEAPAPAANTGSRGDAATGPLRFAAASATHRSVKSRPAGIVSRSFRRARAAPKTSAAVAIGVLVLVGLTFFLMR